MERSPGQQHDGAPQPRAQPALAEAPTALLAAASRLLAELESVRQQAAARPGPEAGGEAAAAAAPQRGAHQLGSRLLVALSLIVGADYLSPISLLASADEGRLLLSLATFLTHLPATIEPLGQAARVLLLYGVCCTATRHRAAEAVQAARSAAELLATPEGRAAVERQLVRLHAPAAATSPHSGRQQAQQQQQQQQQQGVSQQQTGSPPGLLTVQQLQHACWWRVAEIGSSVLAAHRSPSLLLHAGSARLSSQQLADIEAAVAAAAAALLELEPTNPKGLLAAGSALAALGQPAAADELYLQALQAAQQQSSSYYELRAAAALLSRGPQSLIVRPNSSSSELQLSATARATTAVLVSSAPALRQCEQGLPPAWWMPLRSEVARGWRAVTTAQAELNLFKLLAHGMPGKGPAAPVSPRPAGAQQQQRQQPQRPQQSPQQQQQQQRHRMQQSPQQQQQQAPPPQQAPAPLQPSQQNQPAGQPGQPAKQQVQLVSGHTPWEAAGPAGLCLPSDASLPGLMYSNAPVLSQLLDGPSQFCSALTHAAEPPAGLNSSAV